MANLLRWILLLLAVIASSRAAPDILTILNKMSAKIDDIEKAVHSSCLAQGKDCADLYKKGYRTDGVYSIDPDGKGAFKVRCDMTTSLGGWTVFQRRIDGSVDFFRYWKDYKNGFGDPAGEFWLGLDKINRLTNSGRNVIRIDMGDTKGNTKYAVYDFFAVASEQAKYKLSLGAYSGTADDAFGTHRGMAFSTRDVDRDTWVNNCAASYKGGWWYAACHRANLNGYYYLGSHTSYADGVNWYPWKGYYYSLRKAEMKIRPSGF